MNHEFERHILTAKRMGNDNGVVALKALQTQYQILAVAGIVPVLPKESFGASGKKEKEKKPGFTSSDKADLENLPFGKLVAYFRIRKGISQKNLAEKLGYSQASISDIEHEKLIPVEQWSNILGALDLIEDGVEMELLERKREQELAKLREKKNASKLLRKMSRLTDQGV